MLHLGIVPNVNTYNTDWLDIDQPDSLNRSAGTSFQNLDASTWLAMLRPMFSVVEIVIAFHVDHVAVEYFGSSSQVHLDFGCWMQDPQQDVAMAGKRRDWLAIDLALEMLSKHSFRALCLVDW